MYINNYLEPKSVFFFNIGDKIITWFKALFIK